MKIYSKVCKIVFDILKWMVAVAMMFMVVLTFVEVIRRYFFHQNWVWSEVLVRYLIVWCTFLGGAAAYRVGSLTNFDLIIQKMNKKTCMVFELVCNAIILVLTVWLTMKGVESFGKPSIVGQISVELHISMRWIYLGIPIGFAAMVLFAIEKIIHNITELKGLSAADCGKETEAA